VRKEDDKECSEECESVIYSGSQNYSLTWKSQTFFPFALSLPRTKNPTVGSTMEDCRILLYPMGIRWFLSESLVQESNRKL